MEEWIEEFLYRGRPPSGADSEKAPTFHVVIGQQVDSPFEDGTKQRRVVGPLTVEAAEQAGWTLPEIFAAMNGDAVKQCESLQAELTSAKAEIEQRNADVQQHEATIEALERHVLDQAVIAEARDNMIAALEQNLSERDASIVALQQRVAELTSEAGNG